MANIFNIKREQSIDIEFEEEDIEIALVKWLNLLIGEAGSHNLILSDFELKRAHDHWVGKAYGEAWHDELDRGTEVKGATLTMLSVKKLTDQWEARCVLDV